jgi:hypothetical protein
MKTKNFIYHYGLFGKNANSGDVILYNRLEKIFDIVSEQKNIWYHRLAFGEITSPEIPLINKYCKLIIVGGHGLLMPDANSNNTSGWGFNINLRCLNKINIPLVFFAIGYNIFERKDIFHPCFSEHLKACVNKALFFGLRNYGSIRAVKKYLPAYLYRKIYYQPCPTTITALFENNSFYEQSNNNEIAVSVAFNRLEDRLEDKYLIFFSHLIRFCKYMTNRGYNVSFCGHHILDIHSKYGKYFLRHGFKILPLYEHTEQYIYNYYRNKKLVISMRGHGLMIPFGLSVPVISLTTQKKQKWFIETTGHYEWHIRIDENVYNNLVKQTFRILNSYDYIKTEIVKVQSINKKITEKNIEYIINSVCL